MECISITFSPLFHKEPFVWRSLCAALPSSHQHSGLGSLFQGEETFSSPTPATFWGRGVPAHSVSGAVTPEAVGADCWSLWVMTAPHGWEWDPC